VKKNLKTIIQKFDSDTDTDKEFVGSRQWRIKSLLEFFRNETGHIELPRYASTLIDLRSLHEMSIQETIVTLVSEIASARWITSS
jgi:hypothetical protein